VQNKYDLIVVGGGAAGFFAAINYAALHNGKKVLILEKSAQLLGKVKVSGGGRCNVTHACFEVKDLVKFYPRGSKELLGAFYKFQPADTIEWFKKRGVNIKKEADGRMFPVTDNSQTIIDCFLKATQDYAIDIKTQEGLISLAKPEATNNWKVVTTRKEYEAAQVIITTGSSEQIWKMLGSLGHAIEPPVPSLFTFNVKDPRINNLMGVAVKNATVKVDGTKLKEHGPLLITHWGFSGPAVLKLSAWGARALHQLNYHCTIEINWNANYDANTIMEYLQLQQRNSARQKVINHSYADMPSRLWQSLINQIGISDKNWADINKKQLQLLANELTQAKFEVKGKSTFKEEFVTCGGVKLNEVDFKTMESKIHANLYFSGEVLNIDAITGGFNFQAAWTTAWIAANAMK
jgi:predicted Rossmann fold flavoprotein